MAPIPPSPNCTSPPPSAGRAAAARRAAVPRGRQRARRHRLVRRHVRRDVVGEPYRDGRRPHRACRAGARRRRAVPGRRVSRDRAESACPAGDFGEPDAAGAGHRRRSGARPRTGRPGAAGAVRELRRPQRDDHRPVRAPVDAHRARSPAPRYPSSTATSATSRCGHPTPTGPRRSTATCSGWTYDPATHQVTNTEQHIGIYSVPGQQHAVLLLRGGRPAGARRGDRRRRRHRRRVRGVRLRHAVRRDRPAGHHRSPCSSPRPASRGPSSTALGPASFRTSPTRWRTRPRSSRSTAGCCSGRSSRAASTTAGRCSRPTRWPASPAAAPHPVTVPMWTVADIDAAVARVREAGGTVIDEPSQQSYGTSAQCTDDQGTRFYLGEF